MNNSRIRLLVGSALLAWGLGCGEGRGERGLAAPFDLSWGDSPAHLVDWAVRTKLDQVVIAPAHEPRLKILKIAPAEGNLPGHQASMVEARFMDGRLFEVAVHYTYPGKNADFVRGRFFELKRKLAARHGFFKPGGKQRTMNDGIVTQSEAFRIDPDAGTHLLAVLTEVKDAKRGDAAARFSIVYHNGEVARGEGQAVIIRGDDPQAPGVPPLPR